MGLLDRWRTVRENRAVLARIDGKAVKYVARRSADGTAEQILGKTGRINVLEGQIVVMCDGRETFRCRLADTSVGELLSLGGVVLTGVNALTGAPDTAVAYYTKLGY